MAKPEAPPDSRIAELLAAARAGDDRSLEAVIRFYQSRVAGYVLARVGRDCADFDDLCQVVFVKMALSLPRLRSIEAFEPWLLRIASNVCRDHFRRLKLRALFVPLSRSHENVPADQPVVAGGPRELDRAVEKLSAQQRVLIDLLGRRDYSYEDLARLTRSSVRAVAGRLFRARARLRKLMRYDGADQ